MVECCFLLFCSLTLFFTYSSFFQVPPMDLSRVPPFTILPLGRLTEDDGGAGTCPGTVTPSRTSRSSCSTRNTCRCLCVMRLWRSSFHRASHRRQSSIRRISLSFSMPSSRAWTVRSMFETRWLISITLNVLRTWKLRSSRSAWRISSRRDNCSFVSLMVEMVSTRLCTSFLRSGSACCFTSRRTIRMRSFWRDSYMLCICAWPSLPRITRMSSSGGNGRALSLSLSSSSESSSACPPKRFFFPATFEDLSSFGLFPRSTSWYLSTSRILCFAQSTRDMSSSLGSPAPRRSRAVSELARLWLRFSAISRTPSSTMLSWLPVSM
eukprot:PhM_4_TR3385/c0_g1_i1/m.10608